MALQVSRWRRYGKDRLYVNGEDGQAIGWLDMLTGDRHVLQPDRAGAFELAILGYRPDELAATDRLSPDSIQPPVGTLTDNKPGAALATQARLARQRAPVSSFFGRLLGLHTEERAWRVGLRGEQLVARQLGRLNSGNWKVLHSVPVGRGSADIDHFVVGPGGIFVMNTKHHPGGSVWVAGDTVFVNGQRHPYIRNLRYEADRAARLLSQTCDFDVHVRGLLVIAGANRVKVRRPPEGDDVAVVGRRKLVAWLRKQPVRLAPDDVKHIHARVADPQAWRR